jgi:C-terminal processing protease CtpA/Prc
MVLRATAVSVVLLIAPVLSANDLAAQQIRVSPDASATPVACRGDNIRFRMGEGGDVATFPVVSGVLPDTPAELAGLRPGDMIVDVDGRDSRQPAQRQFAPGDSIVLGVDREGQALQLVLFFGQMVEVETSEGPKRVCRPVARKP